jgi:hypothetical protein
MRDSYTWLASEREPVVASRRGVDCNVHSTSMRPDQFDRPAEHGGWRERTLGSFLPEPSLAGNPGWLAIFPRAFLLVREALSRVVADVTRVGLKRLRAGQTGGVTGNRHEHLSLAVTGVPGRCWATLCRGSALC